MTTLQAFILGIIQGITEFLPISSSGHLHLAQHLLGLKQLDRYMLFDLACHLGTLLAIMWVFFNDIKEVFGPNKKRLMQLAVGVLPLFPLVLIMKPIKTMYADPAYLGFFFILTSIILFIGVRFSKEPSLDNPSARPLRDAFSIGLWQAMAILPGVSRSGSTITGARLLGWNSTDAIAFSFLLAIPAVLGGTVLELWALWKNPTLAGDVSIAAYTTGFIVSLVTGMAALKFLIYLSSKNKFFYFAWYCLFLGLATTYYFHLYRG